MANSTPDFYGQQGKTAMCITYQFNQKSEVNKLSLFAPCVDGLATTFSQPHPFDNFNLVVS